MKQDAYTLILQDGEEYSGSREELIAWARESRVPPGSRIRLENGENVDASEVDWLPAANSRKNPPVLQDQIQKQDLHPNAIEHVIPVRNVPALLAWYFGVFSLIPIIGLILGVIALILGIIGIKKSRDPKIGVGFWHALIGLLIGGICMLLWTIALVMIIAGMTMVGPGGP